MIVGIIEYNAGNLASVTNAFKRLNVEVIVSGEISILNSADRIVFPGVGNANSALKDLKDKRLDDWLKETKKPVLGICLGMQLMGRYNEEAGGNGLGLINASVKEIPANVKVPHMGWNNLGFNNSPLFKGIEQEEDFYFVHSYYMEENPFQIATVTYGKTFCVAFQKDNLVGVQFHPEKSGANGAKFLKNFLEWKI